MFALLLLILLPAIFAYWNFVWKRRALPPGPTPLPFLGNLLALKPNIYEAFLRWTKQYGPIFTFWAGEEAYVTVTEYELMRELFVKQGDALAGRDFQTKLFTHMSISNGKLSGIFLTEGEPWKVLRRFSLQTMRNLGMGRAQLEQQFLSDIAELICNLRKEEAGGGVPLVVDMQKHIDVLVGSVINRVLFGYPFKGDKLADFYELKKIIDKMMKHMVSVPGFLLFTRPWLRHLPYFAGQFAKYDSYWCEALRFVDGPIQARIAAREKNGEHNRSEEPGDFLDYFLDQMDLVKTGKVDPDTAEHFTMDHLRMVCSDLFLAGQETTATTLTFLVLYLMLDQRVQAKMQAELDGLDGEEHKGHNGVSPWIGLADRTKLPYLNAVINETQRLCNLLPNNITHRTMCDVEVMNGKYRLPKGTIITPQISCVLFDEKIFPNPYNFEPERFLDENGKLKKCDELIPFSLGKRQCLGESMARTELFLFTANFFRNFKVYPADPLHPPSSEKQMAFGVRIKPFKCRLVPRAIKSDYQIIVKH